MKPIFIEDKRNTQIVAHRGLSGIERENTLPAFVAAGNRSCFGIECDVHVTKDGQYLVYHDDTTGRLCEKDISLEASTAEQLRGLRIKDAQSDKFTDSLKMPALSEYLAVCARYEKTAVVELKNPMSAGHIAKIVEICGNVYDLRRVVFISFCFENLVEVRKIKEDQTVQFLCDKYGADLLERLKRHKFDLDIYYRALTREAVSELHAAGVKVNCWTCDDKKDAEELISWGVDYITSNILE
ncbi:MAG TPA: hypothetical protein H9727_05950 [Candidatus Borkfalkia avistercoris]|uniref:GP-PDE domain-containing protein n=1 Tax=Candidatus Borkfalkia avistercoris TaxID=2838504 RepID=A0A9D2IEN5_9FIRM|nr:hypothetical protein [Candidatus Borkfalkia avistercoris]